MESRKAIHFDLDYKMLKQYFKYSNPQYAYALIGDFFNRKGFKHVQYSGYHSEANLNLYQVEKIVSDMTREFPWLSKCVKSFTVTDIGEIYELKNQIKTIDIKTPEVNHEGGKIKHKKNIDITR